ncbi:tetratricopeptide repeat protein [Nodosilinea nodulosa]|uniref:tetratricopeptide repeat protein n=1 Tax=Nodosilinea nodulosa TaxID=416001 RepID=UPI0002D6676B|nr:tetratricopeptide repeat protein [Nodosilinea nodulosa]
MTDRSAAAEVNQLMKPESLTFDDVGEWSPKNVEALNDLLRALRRKKNFGLFFVQCNPAQSQRIIGEIQENLSRKRLVKFELNRDSETLYDELIQSYDNQSFEIACITGVEQAMYRYEDTQRLAGWTSEEIYNYSWKGLPPLLSHLNRQREAFEEHLPISLVFLVPSFVIDYFVQRAPDFFDWRSGFFKLEDTFEDEQKSLNKLMNKDYDEYISLTPEERVERVLDIKDKILQNKIIDCEKRSDLLREQGRLFESGGDIVRALDCYERALFESSNNYKAWHNKGKLLHDSERFEEAIECYENILELKPDFHFAWAARGVAYLNLKKYELASHDFERFLELQPQFGSFWIIQGALLFKLKKYVDAIEKIDYGLFKSASELQFDNCYAWTTRGDAFLELERFKEAIGSYDQAIKIQPEYYAAWRGRGDALKNLEFQKEAIESYDRALEIKPELHYLWAKKGSLHLVLGEYNEVLRSCNKALEIKPDLYDCLGLLGAAHNELGQHEEAIKCFDDALTIRPDFFAGIRGKGIALYSLGNHQAALNCFKELVQICPEDKHDLNNLGFLTLSRYSYGLKAVLGKPLLIRIPLGFSILQFPASSKIDQINCQDALEFFDAALKIDPKLTLAWANISFPAYYLGRHQDALKYCDRALELDSKNKEAMNDVIYSNQGSILLQLHNPVYSLNAFDTALTLNHRLDEAWIGKGTALSQLKRYDEAIHSFTQALHLNHPLAQANLDSLQDCIY